MENENSLQTLCIPNVTAVTNYNGYLIVEKICGGLNEDCHISKVFNSKHEADAAPHNIVVEYGNKKVKFERGASVPVEDPSYVYNPQNAETVLPKVDALYFVFWTFSKEE